MPAQENKTPLNRWLMPLQGLDGGLGGAARPHPLLYAMFEDSSPGPVRYALTRVHDWITEDLRLPLTPCSDAARKAVDAALEHAGLV